MMFEIKKSRYNKLRAMAFGKLERKIKGTQTNLRKLGSNIEGKLVQSGKQ